MESIQEMFQFLHLGARTDLKTIASQQILDLTGNEEVIEAMTQNPKTLPGLVMLVTLLHDSNTIVSRNACLALVNISATEKGAFALVNLEMQSMALMLAPDNIVKCALKFIMDPESSLADPSCMILSNITRPSGLIEKVIDLILESGVTLDQLINVFTKREYNKKGSRFHYLGPTLSNLSQSARIRKYILDQTKCVIHRLLPFTEYKESVVRRGGIVGTLRNCCFEQDVHEWLLSENVDVLPRLLLPLAGNEEFDDEDNDKLPSELQYLSSDKIREEDPDIRCMLLEAITQLCAKKECRKFIRDKNTYVILRELHKWEKDRKALLACENLVDILIRTEEEIGQDNLRELAVPEDMVQKFEKMDEDFVNDN